MSGIDEFGGGRHMQPTSNGALGLGKWTLDTRICSDWSECLLVATVVRTIGPIATPAVPRVRGKSD